MLKSHNFFNLGLQVFYIIILLTSKAFANDEYKPDDENCLKYAGKICSEIVEPKDCTTQYLVKDSQGRVLSTTSRNSSEKRNGILITTESITGCYGHFNNDTKYYFNDDLDFESTNCAKVFETWKNIKRKLGTKKKEGFFEECFASEPESLTKICSEKSIGINKNSSSCYLTQDSFTNIADLILEKSDISGYKFLIREEVMTTY